MISMAYKRSLSFRSTLLARTFNPSSFTYISHYNDGKKSEELHSSGSKMETFLSQRRSLGCYVNNTFCRTSYGLGNGISLRRKMSTSTREANEAVSSVFEVAVAAADSAFPVAAVQYVIDGVHTLTGLNWWASIAIATLLVRGATVPLYISVLRKHSLKLALMLSQSIMILKQMEATGQDPRAIAQGTRKIVEIFKEGGVSPYMELLVNISILVSFYLAVLNMAEKVPSFKTGGTLWFTDLSTPDSMYIFPISMALLSLICLESSVKNLTGDPFFASSINIRRACLALWIPVTVYFPNAVFCFSITSKMFIFCFRRVIRDARVKKALGIEMVKSAPPSESSGDK